MKLFIEGTPGFRRALAGCAGRDARVSDSVKRAVSEIIDRVRVEGDAALFDFTRRFDGYDPRETGIEVGREEMERAWSRVPAKIRKSLSKMAERIGRFHEPQVDRGYTVYNDAGAQISIRSVPVERAGVYIPGGKASYPSTAMMNAIPARIAGVREIFAAASSPGGRVLDEVLAACYLAGVDRLFKIGGAQAVAALALGTRLVPKVDVIAGPGNVYVTEAKKQLYGTVGLDMLAGPSELVVLADESANPEYVAYDIISQAEHGEDSFVALVTHAKDVAGEVMKLVDEISRKEMRAKVLSVSLIDGPVFLTKNVRKSLQIVNRLAPEHLSVQVDDPGSVIDGLRSAGTVFVGPYSPVAVGDYIAGINHTLPTGGSARFFSPLGVYHFMKKVNVVSYDRSSLKKDLSDIVLLSRREGLFAHGNAAAARYGKVKRRK